MLDCQRLDFSYGAVKRLHDVSFCSLRGQLTALFGHNGSGKSTLLKMLGASLPILTGHVRFDQQSIIDADGYISTEFRPKIGVLFQSTSSDEKLSCFDNLLYAAKLLGISSANRLEKVHLALEQAGLADRAHEPVKKLSLGLRRRLELYRTFMHNPQLVLLDEPTASLDVLESAKFFAFLKSYQQKNNAVILISSHRAEEILHCDQVLMMKNGRISATGSPQNMLNHLNYFCCTFLLDHKADLISFKGLNLFDQFHDEVNGVIKAKCASDAVDTLLNSFILRNGSLKGFFIEKPSLADVYDNILRREESIGD